MVVVGKHTDKNTSTRIGNCCLLIIMTLLDHKLWMFEFSSIWVYFLSFEGTTLLNSLRCFNGASILNLAIGTGLRVALDNVLLLVQGLLGVGHEVLEAVVGHDQLPDLLALLLERPLGLWQLLAEVLNLLKQNHDTETVKTKSIQTCIATATRCIPMNSEMYCKI